MILPAAMVLRECSTAITHVFFPIDCVVALVSGGGGDPKLEVGLVGNEGMLGVSVMLGTHPASLQWVVLGPGKAWRIEASAFLDQLSDMPELRRELHRYLLVMLAQLVQTSVCTRFHMVEARLARWLLMTRDRMYADSFHITHENLAVLLGVRRAGITRAAHSLHNRNLINYTRGDLRIVDGHGLEAASCICYQADNQTYATVMGRADQPVQ